MLAADLLRIWEEIGPVVALLVFLAVFIWFLDRKMMDSPYPYSTGDCHQTTSCEPCKRGVGKCAICGEGR